MLHTSIIQLKSILYEQIKEPREDLMDRDHLPVSFLSTFLRPTVILFKSQRSPPLTIHSVLRVAGKERPEILRGGIHVTLTAFDGCPGDVRSDDAVLHAQQRIVFPNGFCGHNIQPGTFPEINASARFCSTTHPLRALLIMIMPSFIFSMFSCRSRPSWRAEGSSAAR